jgi:2,4-dienoyl-CoA reductase-like NADH-dependent reductase (Old Yellow Enzyme family)/thioredoxin reductase
VFRLSREVIMKLLEPFSVGTMNLRNRLVMSPMINNYATGEGYVTDRTLAYYEARAAGGVGLIIVEAACVDAPVGKGAALQLAIDDDKCIPGLRELAAVIHKHGAKAAVQLHHAGRITSSRFTGCQPVAPSPIPFPGDELVGVHAVFETPRELTVDEIRNVIGRFAEAAVRAKTAGFDAVEIHAAHGYLINEFLSLLSNNRQDQYGGDLENRARMLVETIAAVKKAVGDSYPVLCRINGEEVRFEGGGTVKDAQEIAKICQAAGIAAIDVSYMAGPDPSYLPMSAKPKGYLVHAAEAVKKAVSIPVIAVYRLTPAVGEQVIKEGKADLIAIGRGFLADPQLSNKAAEGRLDEITPCIVCNTCQYDITSENASLRCAVNPAQGKEGECSITKATRPKKVLVIGGGPGGMKAAIIAAQRGHQVTLFEKEGTLGGQLILAAVPPYKDTLVELTNSLSAQVTRAGVNIVLGKDVTITDAESMAPDAVILATGIMPFVPEIKGIDTSNVVLAEDVLAGKATVGQRVIIIGGELVGCETAEFLTDAGKEVTIMRKGPTIAADFSPMNRESLIGRLTLKNVTMLTGVRYEEITAKGLVITNKEGQKQTIPADTFILAAGARPNTELLDVLKGKVPELYQIGDCLEPRSLLEAIDEGFNVGRNL